MAMLTFSGPVIRGSQRAAALGYPTINLALANMKVDGIFAAKVRVGEREYMAAAFADPLRGVLEAHLLDVDDNFYGREVKMMLHKKLRRNQHFATDELLREAIASDVEAVRAYFANPV
jgi:riboflavin kinase / FMN adenylyltransferase